MRPRWWLLLGALTWLGSSGPEPLLAAEDCSPVAAETGLPAAAGCRGPYRVAHVEYDSATTAPEGLRLEGIATPVDLWGLVAYPDPFPPASMPLVLVLHGNGPTCGSGFRTTCHRPVLHHEGFRYLIDHLASQGFVAVSVNANRLNGADFDRVRERGWLLLAHLRRWAAWAAGEDGPLGDAFAGRVDLERVGLIGHSRGGEAVIAAFNLAQERAEPFRIGAVMAIAPTDKQGLALTGVPFYALVPACDGDVLDYRGVRFFDRALRAPQGLSAPVQLAFALGTNHNHFNSLWSTDGGCTGLQLVPRAEQEALAKTLSAAFLRRYLLGEEALHDLFTGDAASPSEPEVPLWRAYADPRRRVLERFDRPLDPEADLAGFQEAFTCGPGTGRSCSPAFVEEVSVLAVRWWQPGAFYRLTFPEPLDATAFSHLALRAAQNPDDVRFDALRPQGEVVHVRAVLEDVEGNVVGVSSEALGGVPFPVGSSVRDPHSGRFLMRNLLVTLRFPLAKFAGLDLSRLRALTLSFDVSPRGSLYLTDLEFTR